MLSYVASAAITRAIRLPSGCGFVLTSTSSQLYVCFPPPPGARTKEGQVSGSLNLNLSSHVEGEDVSTSFHEQYMRLHEV